MIISIVNDTSLCRQEVQTTIRAVNRQLQEDFRPYWHIDAQLRLEGRTEEALDPNRTFNMRGDGVIYLTEEYDAGRALGYHERNLRGVPCGFVSTGLSRTLAEDWSVTLSHEALEMALDPEVNRLVQGPHPDPDEARRLVYHWYEVCDAVQPDTYRIDGVRVSNFVLPLYFTSSEEHLNHNDFLGKGVQSFGVRRGGYVGFFDPEKGRHDTYHAPDDPGAARRMDEKVRLGNAKRTGRRTANSAADVLNDPRWASCDAISFELRVEDDDAPSLADHAQAVVADTLGDSWSVRVTRGDPREFDAIYIGSRPLTFADAWQFAQYLQAENRVLYAEPSFTHPVPGETDLSDDYARRRFSSSENDHKPETDGNFHWALEVCKVPEAWERFEHPDRNPGEGVLVGHPDSGFVEHPEMDLARVRIDFDRDFLDEDSETRTEKIKHGLHGLATASVLMSGPGEGGDRIRAPAYCAELLPLRVTRPRAFIPAPVLIFGGMRRLRDAVDYAVETGCEVISISLGGLFHRGLRKAIRRANDKGVIVCAAAGNKVSHVVWPARYDEVIAVAACDVHGRPWAGSCRGATVNITAPGESVWRATVSEHGERIVARSSGTSYAVALTASIAAMWLSFHRTSLENRQPAEIPGLFRQLLEQTASKREGLPEEDFGAGIVNAEALLGQPIPHDVATPRRNNDDLAMPDIPEEFDQLGLADETFRQEWVTANYLIAMIDASEPLLRARRKAAQPRCNAIRLSARLTEYLQRNGLSADTLFP